MIQIWSNLTWRMSRFWQKKIDLRQLWVLWWLSRANSWWMKFWNRFLLRSKQTKSTFWSIVNSKGNKSWGSSSVSKARASRLTCLRLRATWMRSMLRLRPKKNFSSRICTRPSTKTNSSSWISCRIRRLAVVTTLTKTIPKCFLSICISPLKRGVKKRKMERKLKVWLMLLSLTGQEEPAQVSLWSSLTRKSSWSRFWLSANTFTTRCFSTASTTRCYSSNPTERRVRRCCGVDRHAGWNLPTISPLEKFSKLSSTTCLSGPLLWQALFRAENSFIRVCSMRNCSQKLGKRNWFSCWPERWLKLSQSGWITNLNRHKSKLMLVTWYLSNLSTRLLEFWPRM